MRTSRVNECLVLMPFGSGRNDTAYSNFVYSSLIAPAIRTAGLQNTRIDKQFVPQEPLDQQLRERLNNAQFVVADLTGNNPNVNFELGFRHARGLPLVCISTDASATAWWGKTFPVVEYDGPSQECIERLAEAIRNAGNAHQIVSRLSAQHLCDAVMEVTREEPNHLIDRVAAWRIESARAQIEALRTGSYRSHARQPREHVAHLFEELAQQLQQGDEYWTITNPDFWSDRQMGQVGFLEQNVGAAIRGASIVRIYLVDVMRDHEDGRSGVLTQLRDQQAAMSRVGAGARGRFDLYVVPSTSYAEDLQVFGHFALIRSSLGSVQAKALILPHHASRELGGDINSLEVRFSPAAADHRVASLMDTYEARFANAQRRGQLVGATTDVRALLRKARVDALQRAAVIQPEFQGMA